MMYNTVENLFKWNINTDAADFKLFRGVYTDEDVLMTVAGLLDNRLLNFTILRRKSQAVKARLNSTKRMKIVSNEIGRAKFGVY
jgi:hypothetical protein